MIALPDWVTPDPDKSAGSPFTSIAHVFQGAIGVPALELMGEERELFSVFKSCGALHLIPGTIVLEGRVFPNHMEMWHWFKDGHSACLYRLPGHFKLEDFPRLMDPFSTGMEDIIKFMMANLEKQK